MSEQSDRNMNTRYANRRESQDHEASYILILASWSQAVYYILTGLWALLSIGTFQKVTGPKTDLWLVKTVGALVIAIGSALSVAGTRRRSSPEVAVLAIGSAASLAAVDVVYVAKKRISPIYLLDAVAESLLIGMWAVGLRLSKPPSPG